MDECANPKDGKLAAHLCFAMFRQNGLLAIAVLVCVQSGSPVWANCFQIDVVNVMGVTLIEQAELDELTDPFAGKCLGLREIDLALRAITSTYIDEGFVAARAYLPPQDLADGTLEIRVVEGALEEVLFNGEQKPLRERSAFGDIRDRPVNLREIEQGIDNIRAPSSILAEMELSAGSQDGLSILNIHTERPKPFRATFSTNNYGTDDTDEGSSAATGQFSDTLGVGFDNLLGLNEQWDLSYTQSVKYHPLNFNYNGAGTEGWSFSFKIPYARMRYGLSASRSSYETFVEDTLNPVDLNGWTLTTTVDARYLLFRGQNRKDYLSFDLTRRENENYIADVQIATSSRVLSRLRIGYLGEWGLESSQLNFDIGLSKGLKILGAEIYDEQPEGQPDAQFTKLDFRLSYTKPFATRDLQTLLHMELSGQYSGDRLYGNEQISIGGPSTLRGSKTSVATGSSGLNWRNQFELPNLAKIGKSGYLSPYATIDFGAIAEQSDADTDSQTASSASVGLKVIHQNYTLDVSIGRLLSDHDDMEADTVGLLSFQMRF
ncbi:hypothetical protein GTA62_07440 [Roseobacter sp. HKCCD9010]|uniref:ShlB/FhaC/HecB family hemolysin secretion/activation protein n=2 Tax=unclassified Roseobacter TaxID=196798 RepID=UPI001491AED7|nr:MULTISPECIES: ShlB/FhaC/HecB family hemolysin secretion/activation protein [unclassified Roseobacter]MBF9052251.1 hypothetical protein [Rhodobacterales bacterium HKCCD4356]NNW64213.1 hypothetical protein [Roseobacter sp. HKCCD8268]NNX78993.1 hypothetical protein [Roseobacter sp. HKCCD8481]NNX87488.1 hypothetical protein [Roseobacter sp. HKCCD8809]NNY98509.1 hypothetical protein [Roseobacter sp. HKCCD9052]NNZ15507.1 hypothetical protein [Roseobacter sp. HKCCD8810]NNZ19782.1 hypothetical pr